MKRTYKGKRLKRSRTHGFLLRMREAPHLINNKRRKKRFCISVVEQ